jgi:hypothetical protein
VTLPNRRLEEADCIVTEDYIIGQLEQPIKIPLSQIKHCDIALESIPVSDFARGQESFLGTVTLTFLDDSNKSHKLTLETDFVDADSFKQAIDRQIIGRFLADIDEEPRSNAVEKLFGLVRDKTRDRMYSDLLKLGIGARIVYRGRAEEDIRGEGSLGILYIPEGPIRWINIRREFSWRVWFPTMDATYFVEYGVPDDRLRLDSPAIRISAIRNSQLHGKVIDVTWNGEDYGTGIINSLENDYQLKEQIMRSQNVSIEGFGNYGCWLISTEGSGVPIFNRNIVPSTELWNCYQSIAKHLLATWQQRKKGHLNR